MKKLGLLLGLLVSPLATAEVIDVEYKRFYSHVRKLNNDDTQALQFAFGFTHVTEGRLCHLNSVDIITQKQTIEVPVSKEQRFLVPSEKALNLADAVVQIDIADNANQCDMSVQLETKAEYLKTSYQAEELAFLYEQYESFFNSMGSFLSFMMPSVEGLVFQFDDPSLDRVLEKSPNIMQGMLTLDAQWFEDNKGLTLPVKPLRITALAK